MLLLYVVIMIKIITLFISNTTGQFGRTKLAQ
ncbi:hypothetical protein CLV51_1011655 [Chitinophaga niastensis]|uniref:Uncharacterized protein n=1 Tax=Chitinophaga niastensis TaxID=536980 RepID=A0A2P8HVQ0_CHINA|nr:hypothetical protein CLV51_1011655 [Chitinophaga niastensis]